MAEASEANEAGGESGVAGEASVASGASDANDEGNAATVAAGAEQAEAVAAPPAPDKRRREMTGVVLSNKADKTITVRIDRRVKHPVYGKIVRRSSKIAAHDERNECREGDVVAIVETRPISKTKSWRLGRVVERAGA